MKGLGKEINSTIKSQHFDNGNYALLLGGPTPLYMVFVLNYFFMCGFV